MLTEFSIHQHFLLIPQLSRALAYDFPDRAITALACSNSEIAIGTELAQQQAIVSIWQVTALRANRSGFLEFFGLIREQGSSSKCHEMAKYGEQRRYH
jgi:hypothetical protein